MSKILSIIVPSYNMEAYLPKCLGSLIIDDKELLQKLDVIVVNDGSKDRTSEIAHEFEAKYPGVFRVIDKANGHYGSCINAALPVAQGVYVKVLDADDSFDTKGLSFFLSLLSDIANAPGNDIDVVFTDYVRVALDGMELHRCTLTLSQNARMSLTQVPDDDIRNLWMQSVTYRTQMLRDAGYRQMEGVPFTDQEWVFYPFAFVRGSYYFPVVVYKYLCGRDGQTIDPVYYVKNFSVIRKITQKQINSYPHLLEAATEGGKKYIATRLHARVMLVYARHIVQSRHELREEQNELLEFDDDLKATVHDIYEWTGNTRYFRRIPIQYVNAWRRHSIGGMFELSLLLYFFIPLFKVVRKMKGLIKASH